MGAVLELIKRVLALVALAVLAACGTPFSTVADAIMNPAEDEAFVVPRVNRAAIEQADLAALMIQNPALRAATVGVAVQKRGPLIIYSANDNRGVTMNGGLVYATLGFGTNLQAVITGPGDPLVEDLAPQDWPPQVTRTYQIAQRGTEPRELSLTCTARIGATTTLDVIEVPRRVTEITELCTAPDMPDVINVHFVDSVTGRVWRSSQWTGPVQGNIQVDIIDQFEP